MNDAINHTACETLFTQVVRHLVRLLNPASR